MTITAKSVIRRAVETLQDNTSIRWPVGELVRYLNDGQREVVMHRPDAIVKNATVTATQVYVVNLKLDADVQALVDAKTISVEIAEGSEYVAANGQVKIVLTHNTSTFGSKLTAK